MYLVAFSTTNMHIHHKVAIGHLMQAWARFHFSAFQWGKHEPSPHRLAVLCLLHVHR